MGNEPTPAAWPARTVSISGRELTIRRAEPRSDEGTLQPALFVHGLGGSSLDWTELMGLLRSDMLCDAVDLPGFGYSPPPARRRDQTLAGYSRVLAELIEFNDRGPVHLVGNSMGGSVATRVAALRPELVQTLTLISPALPDLRPSRDAALIGMVGLPGLGARIARKLAAVQPERRLEMLLNMIFADPSRITQLWRAAAVEEIRRRAALPYSSAVMVGSTRAILWAYADPRPGRLWRLAARVQAPTLLVFGRADKLVHPRNAGRASSTFPNSTLLLLEDSGHVAHLEHPELVADAMREFMERRRPLEIY